LHLPFDDGSITTITKTNMMDEPFELPVTYKGEERSFPAQLLQLGYTHKFQVEVNDVTVLFEPDEERNYRAMIDPEQMDKPLDVALIQAIAEAIEQLVKT
jgi:hypothetical protein